MTLFQLDRFLPSAIPSFITILMFLFLTSLTIRAGKTQRENQLFAVMCLIQLIHHLNMILVSCLSSAEHVVFVYRAVHVVHIFILPVSVHYLHRALDLNHTKLVSASVYGATILLLPFIPSEYYFSAGPNSQYDVLPSVGPILLCFILTAILILMVYTGIIIIKLIRVSGNNDNAMKLKCLFMLVGLIPAFVLTIGDSLPLFGIRAFALGRFVFIPMGIFTYGILRYQILDNKGWFSIGYIPNFLTTLVWLPVLLCLLFIVTAGDTVFHTDITGRLFPAAIPPMLSTLVCFSLATFCFQKGSRQMQTILFGGICTLWGLLNLDVTLLFIIRDTHAALLINRLDHFFLVMELGFYAHFLHYFAGLRKRLVYVAYGVSLVFVPLTQTPFYLREMYEYPWGLFARKEILFDIMIGISLIAIMVGCIVLVRKVRDPSHSREEKKQYLFFLLGAISMALLGITNVPAMSGIDVYPFGSFMFIPVVLMAYGVFKYDLVKINAYTKKRLWAGSSAILTCTGYTLLLFVVYASVKPYPMDSVLQRVVAYGLPPIASFSICFFFSILSVRVGPSLTGSRLFGLICMVYAFLSVDVLLNCIVPDPEAALRISRMNHVFLVVWPGLHSHLVYLICRKRTAMGLVWFNYAAGLLFALLSHSPWYLTGTHQYPWGFFARKGPLFDLFWIFAALNVVYSLRLFYTTYRKQSNLVEKQRLMLFSMGLGAAALLTAGNLPAMNGYGVYPAGNYIFIPIAVFGYSMFRKNLKEVLGLLNVFFSIALTALALVLTALIMFRIQQVSLSPGTIFVGLLLWVAGFKVYERAAAAVLSLFFGRQKELLDRLFIRMTDQFSKSRTLEDIVYHVSDPAFQALHASRVGILFYLESDNGYEGCEVLNPGRSDAENQFYGGRGQVSISYGHPLLAMFRDVRGAVSQEQVEEWIADSGVSLPSNEMLRSAAVIQPVYLDATLVCLILFYEKEDGAVYSRVEKEFISRLGFALGPYIENTKLLQGLEQEVEKRTGDLWEALSEITLTNHFIKTANASLNLDDVMPAFMENLKPVFRFEIMFIQLVDRDEGILKLFRAYGHRLTVEQKKQLESLTVPLSDTSSLSVQGVQTKNRVYRNRYMHDESIQSLENTIHCIVPFTSVVILPMEIRNEAIGNILFVSGEAPFDFTGKELSRLQGYVSQIASAVNNARLYDKSEIAIKVKSEFLARMSHEIRSPLNAILGMGDLLSETRLTGEQREYVDIFRNSGGLLLSVINDILDFSKIEASRVSIESIPFDLHKLVGDLRDIISASSRKKGLDIDVDISSEINRCVKGDPVRLSQVLLNLADNAVRFTDRGGVTIRVGRSWNNPHGEIVQFCVEDTGIGIPDGKTRQIFNSFTQEECSTTRKYGGTGLGLTISKKLISLMGGNISVSSEVGKGSKFYFTVRLPSTTEMPESGFLPANNLASRLKSCYELHDSDMTSLGGADKGPFRFLLAEDIKTNIRVVEHYLKGVPAIMDIAATGTEAVRMYRDHRYDLVLMDIHMPEMDGLEAMALIRKWEQEKGLPKTPVIALSAHMPDGPQNRISSEFDVFLMKPFGRYELLSALEKVLPPLDSADRPPTPATHSLKEPVPPFIDPDYVDIIPELIREIRSELITIETCLEKSDFSTVLRLSHGFKGAAGNCGLTVLSEKFNTLTMCAGDKDYDLACSMTGAIRDYVARLQLQLN